MRSNNSNPLLLWFRIVRPQTLFASLCPVMVALLVVYYEMGLLNTAVAVLTIVCALSLQILSNLINDYYDYRRGTDKKGRVGFKRALAEGLVSERQMLRACMIALGVAVLTGAVLCYVGGWGILIIGLTAILFAWLYTATDHSLSYLGIADIFVFLYYGVIASVGTWWLQLRAADIHLDSVLPQLKVVFYAGAVCGLISMCVLAINNIRDIEDDREAGKKTFPVRFGKPVAEAGMGVLVLLMPLLAWSAFGLGWTVGIVLPAGYMFYRVLRAKGAQYNTCLLLAGMVNVCYVLLVWQQLA